jgi:hypothetical protein
MAEEVRPDTNEIRIDYPPQRQLSIIVLVNLILLRRTFRQSLGHFETVTKFKTLMKSKFRMLLV